MCHACRTGWILVLPLGTDAADRCVPGHTIGNTPPIDVGPAVRAAMADVADDGEWCDDALRPACVSCSPLEPSVCKACETSYTLLGQRCGARFNVQPSHDTPLRSVVQRARRMAAPFLRL